MPRHYREVEALLKELELALKKSNLWSPNLPSEQALNSKLPFACDYLHAEQWLQFLFIPKMQAIIDSQQELPVELKLLPALQERFYPMEHGKVVLRCIENIDEWFND
jgi:uncharacterized protein YqcC (DUF446 family)